MTPTIKPNLFIVGAPKCGTTAWVDYLSSHSDIFFAYPKEPHYFCEDFPSFRFAKTEKDYAEFFKGAESEVIIGEGSVRYLYSKQAAQNIYKFNPKAKILIFIRSRATFLYSYHNQVVLNGEDDVLDFEKAWRLSINRTRTKFPKNCPDVSFLDYVNVGKFAGQIQRYLDVFPKEQIRVVRFETWTKNPQLTYQKIIKFLELESDGRTQFEKIHEAKHNRFPFLNRFIQNPPKLVLLASKGVKTILGKDSLDLAVKVTELNKTTGYTKSLTPELRDEIETYFADDMLAVEQLIRNYALEI